MITYPLSSILIALPSWAYYVLFGFAALVTFLTLRGRRFSLSICSATAAFGIAYGIGNLFFHAQNGAVPHLTLMTQAPYTSALWIVAGAAALIASILAYFWKSFGLFFSSLLFGFTIGLLISNRLMLSILLGFFMAFFHLLSPHLIWLFSSTLAGSLWAGESMGLILRNSRFHNVLLWSAGFFIAGSLFQWVINRDLFKKQSLTPDSEEDPSPSQTPAFQDTAPHAGASTKDGSPNNIVSFDAVESGLAPAPDENQVPPPTLYPTFSPENASQDSYPSLQTSESQNSYNALQSQSDEVLYDALQSPSNEPLSSPLQKDASPVSQKENFSSLRVFYTEDLHTVSRGQKTPSATEVVQRQSQESSPENKR